MTRPILLDYGATTPVDPDVLEVMLPYFTTHWGNAGSSHSMGRHALEAIARSRALVAELVGAKPEEITFTSGATEANNLAILGAVRAANRTGRLLASLIEHKSVLDACRQAEREGHRATWVRPDSSGRIHPQHVRDAADGNTVVGSFMLGNNEIGTLNPIAEIADAVADRSWLLHCDATQGIGQVPFDVHETRVDLVSFSAHKLYGPKGIGALYVRKGIEKRIAPLSWGGGQERGLRSGTLNVPAIVGFGEACRIARLKRDDDAKRIRALRDRLRDKLQSRIPGMGIHGSLELRLPGNLNAWFALIDAQRLLEALDGQLCVSVGSACTSKSLEPSHVLRGIGVGNDKARSSIRFGIGRFTTEHDIDAAVELIVDGIRRQQTTSAVWSAALAAS